MGPRRRKWRRRAAKAALAALALALLGLLASGEGEELLAAALAAWGERGDAGDQRGDAGEWAVGSGEAWGGTGGSVFMNGGRGNGAWRAGGGRGGGKGGWGVLNGSWGGTDGGPEVGIGGPGGGFGGPGVGFGGPGDGFGGPGVEPGDPRVPPGCSGLLSGGSGDLPRGPWAEPPRPPATPRLLLAPAPCAPAAPFLLILVPSAPPHRDRRLAVRDTWGGPWPASGSPPARTVFVLGAGNSAPSQRSLLAESRQHGDILQGDFADSYANLTLKTLLLLRWARSCCAGAPFLLKADDDVFVNVPAIATYLSAWPPSPPPRLYLGRVHWAVRPDRDPRSRHHVPAGVYGAGRYPPYCSGTAYVLSRQAAAAVLREARGAPLALPEDAWVGLCARRAGMRPRHSARFGGSWRFPAERCCLGRALFSAHRLRPREMRGAWRRLRDGDGAAGCAGGALGVMRCRAMALREWMWGGEGREGAARNGSGVLEMGR